MISIRSRMALSASSVIFAALSSAPAFAVDAVAADATMEGDGLGEIVVTAQKRPENLQSTPISISVMRSEDLGSGPNNRLSMIARS